MNTLYKTTSLRNTFAKLDQAIHRLESICSDCGAAIIDVLRDYEDLPFIDLLIKTGMELEALENQLEKLLQAGIVTAKESFYTTEYQLNESKLLLIALIIFQFAEVNQPFLHLANFGITGFLVLSLIFIFLIGHEIVFLILYLVTQSKGEAGGNNATHFIIFTLVYLANIGLVYARNAAYIDWDVLYVHAFILCIGTVIDAFSLLD